jgi:hypothetical protein
MNLMTSTLFDKTVISTFQIISHFDFIRFINDVVNVYLYKVGLSGISWRIS